MRTATFSTGKPCIYGHGNLRYLSNHQCVECKRLECARRYVAHPERFAARSLAWMSANNNKEKWLAARPAYRKANRERLLVGRRAWKEKNRGRLAACEQKRRARKKGALGGGVTPNQWQEVLVDSLGLCAYCSQSRRLTMDHIDPLSCGGTHDPENVAAVCLSCNSEKSDRPLLLWLAVRARYKKALPAAA